MKKIIRFLDAASVVLAVIWLVLILIVCSVVAFVGFNIATKLILIGGVFFLGGGWDAVGIIFFSKDKPKNESPDTE